MPADTTPQLITQYAYAKRRGCTHRAVQKAIESGRLVKALHRQGDKLLVDPVVADTEWAQNTDTSKPSNTVAPRKSDPAQAVAAKPSRAQPSALAAQAAAAAAPHPSKAPAGSETKGTTPSGSHATGEGEVEGRHISESRAVREAYLAELAKLEYLEAAGKLIDAEEARRLVFKAAREARNALKALPDTITDKLFTAPDIHTCRRILDDAVNKICAALFEAAGKATGGPPDGGRDE